MRWIVFSGSAGYVGTDYIECISYTDVTDEHLNETSYELAMNNAESYEHLVCGWGNEISDEEHDAYYDSIMDYCDWREVTEEEFNQIEL